jgi:hypothetical protein
VNGAPMARLSIVPELPRQSPAGTPMALPAYLAEAPRGAMASRPLAPLAAQPTAATWAPVAPNPAMTPTPKPVAPSAAALDATALERLADKVGQMIARRVAVERERRGR